MQARLALIADRLDRLYETYDIRFLEPDPLAVVRRFSSAADREIGGFCAAALAFGGVRTIVRDVEELFRRMDGSPSTVVHRFDPARGPRRFDGWYHRFIRGEDIAALCWALRRVLEEHGSLGALFAKGFELSDGDIAPALARFVEYLRGLNPEPIRPGRFYGYLLSSPEDGSACKRMNLFLRWMVRRDMPDLRLWMDIPPSHLVIPLDTHVARISRAIGLTRRITPNWRMAREITDALREIDPNDPVKFDYALSRLGILNHCPRRRDPRRCAVCPIHDICTL